MSAVPDWIRANARRGLAWYAAGQGGAGLRPETVSEAKAMASGHVTVDKARRMVAWFARHRVDLDAYSAQVGNAGYPSPGVVAHSLWGGGSRTSSSRAAAWAARYARENTR